MTKTHFPSLAAAFLLILFNSCGKDLPPQPPVWDETHSLNFTACVAGSVKSTLDEGTVRWCESDADLFHIYENYLDDGVECRNEALAVEVTFSEDFLKAEIEATFSTVAQPSLVTGYSAVVAASLDGNNPQILQNQWPSADSYDPDADILVCGTFSAGDGQIQFERSVSINRMTLKGLIPGEKISDITLRLGSDTDIVCSYDSVPVGEDGTFTVYFICGGGNFTPVVEVVSERSIYNKTFNRQVAFNANELHSFGVNLEGTRTATLATTVAELASQISATTAVSANAVSAVLDGAVVTYVNGAYTYLEDNTGALLLYGYSLGLTPGQRISGPVGGSGYKYNNLPELTSIDLSGASVTYGAEIPLTELTSAQLLADFDRYVSCRVKVKDALVSVKDSKNGFLDGVLAYYLKVNGIAMTAGSSVDAVGFPCYFKTAQQLSIFEAPTVVGDNPGQGEGSADDQPEAPAGIPQWLELPAEKNMDNCFRGCFGSGTSRNYSYLYDKSMFASLWTAYPLTSSHLDSGRTDSWAYNPQLDSEYQVSIFPNSYPTQYNASAYARGHHIPNADRNGDDQMVAQTFYVTNQSPQIQDNFNSGIWSSLEGAIRGTVSSDTTYVVTGVSFRTVGGNETIVYLTAATSQTNPQRLPVPTFWWKAVLKVHRSGSQISSARAVAFWFENKAYSGGTYSNYAISVDELESRTGFDFFANLPDAVETTAETNSNWSSFQSF